MNDQKNTEPKTSNAFRDVGREMGKGLAEGLASWPEVKPKTAVTNSISLHTSPLNESEIEGLLASMTQARAMMVGR